MSTECPILNNRPIDKWKVTELKEELKRRKLTTRGLKRDLVKRLGDALRIEIQNTATNDDHHSVDAFRIETENTATNDDHHSVDALRIERENTATNDDHHSVDALRIERQNTATNDDLHSQPRVDALRVERENTATNDDHHSQPRVDALRVERENTEAQHTATNDDHHSQPIVEEGIENSMPTSIVQTLKEVVDHGDGGTAIIKVTPNVVHEVPLIQQHLHVNSDVQIDNEGPKLENNVDALNKLDNDVNDMQDSSSLNKLETDVDDMQDCSALNKLDNDVHGMQHSSALNKLDNDVDDMQDSYALNKLENDVDDMQDSYALNKLENDVDDVQDCSALNKLENDVDDVQDSSALNKLENDVDDMQDSYALNKLDKDVDDMQDCSALNKLENDVDDVQDSSPLNKPDNDVDDMQDSSALNKAENDVDVEDMQDSSALNKLDNDVDDTQDPSPLNKPDNDVDDMQDSSALNKAENDVDVEDMQDSSALNKLDNDVDDMQHSSALNKQAPEIKSDPVSENIEVKDNIIDGNAKLSLDVVKPEMDEQSVKNNASVVERDYHNNDSGEMGYSEKLNLDRSSSDEFMEEDLVETKQIDSKCTTDEIGDNSMKDGSSTDKQDIFVEKRKLHDEEAIGSNEPPKRHKLDSDNLQAPEQQATNLTLTSTPKDTMQLAASKSNYSTSDSPKQRVVPPSQKPPTTSLRVDNFLRPFTLKAVQQLLGETGIVTSFWMDEIKTHCYVTYSSAEEAIETRNAIYNLQWPPNGGRQLRAEFVDPHQVTIHLQTTPQICCFTAPQQLPENQLSPSSSNSNPPLVPPPPSEEPESPMPTIDDIFWLTKATPKIYYLPLSKEQVAAKQARRDKKPSSGDQAI